MGREPGKLRIAFFTQTLIDSQPTAPDCVTVLSETAATLRELSYYLGRPARRDDVELNTWSQARLAEGFSATDLAFQKHRWNVLNRAMGQLHETYDLFLTPTLPRPPIAIGTFQNSVSEQRLLKLVDTVSGLK